MPRLVGTETWQPSRVDSQIDFLTTCAEKHRQLSVHLRSLGAAPEEILEFVAAQPTTTNNGVPASFYMRAAEFALVTGATERGVALLRRSTA